MIGPSRRKSISAAAERAYRQVVQHARNPVFFKALQVPDTVDGRFELICLHAFLFLHRLKSEQPQSAAISQAFFDAMFADMDRGLREMGTGDLSVGRHIKRMAQGFYGRIRAYQHGLGEGEDAALSAALTRNLFGTIEARPPVIAAMIDYVRRAARELEEQSAIELCDGCVRFPSPIIGAPTDAGAEPVTQQ